MKKGTTQLSKFKLLAKRLALPDWQVVGLLESMWMFTQTETPHGDLGSKTDDAIAIQIGIEASEWRRARDSLIAERWLDPDSRFRFTVHDFAEHAPEWLKKQMQRSGESFVVADGGGEFQTLADVVRRCPPPSATGGQRRPVADNGGLPNPLPTQPNPTPPVPVPPPDPGAGGTSTTKTTVDAVLRLAQTAIENPNPRRPFFNGEVSLAARNSLIATWNATPGRAASGRDCRGLVAALDRIASSPDVPPLAASAPLEWLVTRAAAYVRSSEATRDGGRWKCTLGNFLDKDKWLEPDEAWAFQQADAGQESESDRTLRKLGLQ